MEPVSMDKIILMLQKRQGDKSPEVFAPVIDIPAPTLRSYYTGLRTIGLANGRKLIAYFEEVNDLRMSEALRAYLSEKLAI